MSVWDTIAGRRISKDDPKTPADGTEPAADGNPAPAGE
jgi:hypothetical protein